MEIRYFLIRLNLAEDVYIISDDLWENAKGRLAERFSGSLNLESCLNLIKDFEATNPKYKYKSDLEIFIRESALEDFVGENMETIFVSTIHKAKGREFDNVFLMLDQFDPGTNEAKRQLYVAMTRAKNNLTFYDNGNYLNSIKVEDMQVIADSYTYLPPQELVMQLSHRDVQLDFFLYCRPLIKDLNSGESLGVNGNGCYNSKGQAVLKFSHRFLKQIESMRQKNYVPKTAKIRFIVYWQKENTEVEVRIVLPELYFEKTIT
ncbi:3'-5' exonuclease [Desulfosporosinus hippei]|uniref:ATP-dependent DNA helicase RecQ n=1 Tax=Desulfosporosinus hippei DSM 8344 TaxID=1121419 RepID=A0A1G8LD16_9FIRM|nr:3'-5' exonuclease [Desulfosporosinus hippei]SDI53609.1 ATP-dependent DNA helicase RecQ [Desulfosporosinus hippei DSM 8344]